jgi:lipopolysaccharide export system permease protein
MKILRRYIGLSVLNTIMLVIGLLIGSFIFILFVAELPDIGEGYYGIWEALEYVLLCIPQQAYQFFPMAALVGCLMGLGTLANHSELVVMRSSGVTVMQIAWAVIRIAFILAIIVGIMGEAAAPWLLHHANIRKEEQLAGGRSIATARGIWLREEDAFIRIKTVLPHNVLEGITIYTFDSKHQLTRAESAKTAAYREGTWYLHEVMESQFKGDQIKQEYSDTKEWPIKIKPGLLGNDDAQISPEDMNLVKLHWYAAYLEKNGLTDKKYALSFWRRLLQPFAILIMMFLAVPFVFGQLRTLPMGYRIVTGIIVGFGFYFLDQMLGTLSLVYHFPVLLSAILPLVPFGLLGCWLLHRIR